jgi:hypothetical protein
MAVTTGCLSPWLIIISRRSQWPRGLRRRSTAVRLLRSWVRIPLETWMSVCCECYVLSGRGHCDELITRPDESYRLWCVDVCDLEKIMPRPTKGLLRQEKKKLQFGSIWCDWKLAFYCVESHDNKFDAFNAIDSWRLIFLRGQVVSVCLC